MKHYFTEFLESHCYRKAILPEIKSANDKNKIGLSVVNFVNSYAIVFGYYTKTNC